MEERRIYDRRNYLMTDQDIAERVSVSVNTVRYWRQIGTLPFVRVGRCSRVWYSEFQKLFRKPQSPWGKTADTMSSAESNIRRQL